MSILVESLKRLFEAGKILKEILLVRVGKGTITEEEFKFIVGQLNG